MGGNSSRGGSPTSPRDNFMAFHSKYGQLKPDGYYWVQIHFFGTTKLDWHLAEVRTGHFRWVKSMLGGNIPLEPVTLTELVDKKIPMVLIEKPKF